MSNFSYISKYDSLLLRGKDDSTMPRPWNLTKKILAHDGKNKKLLDIGCGTAFKLIPLFPHFYSIIGLDISEDMVFTANKMIHENNISTVKVIHGNSNALPFEDKTYDIVTCMLSRWDVKEIARVLKPNGVVIIEHIGCEDKKDFKLFFGKDDEGWRGQFLEHQKDEYLDSFYRLFIQYFDHVSIENGFWRTYYNFQGIQELLQFTPTIRNFSFDTDAHFLEKAVIEFSTPQGIGLIQNRLLIHAKNIK